MNYTQEDIKRNGHYIDVEIAKHYLNNEIILIGKMNDCYFHSRKKQILQSLISKKCEFRLHQVNIKANTLYTRETEKVFVKGPSLNIDTNQIEVFAVSFQGEQIILPLELFIDLEETTVKYIPYEYMNILKTPMPQILGSIPPLKKEQKESNSYILTTNIYVKNMLVVKI